MSVPVVGPPGMRLGTKTALLGSLLVASCWLASVLAWVLDRQEELARRPASESSALREQGRAALRQWLETPIQELDCAVRAARAAAAVGSAVRSASRSPAGPALRDLVRDELARTTLAQAWIRDATGEVSWAPRGAVAGTGPPQAGACIMRLPGGRRALGRRSETLVPDPWSEAGPFVAGAALPLELAQVPGRWSVQLPVDGTPVTVAAAAGWDLPAVPDRLARQRDAFTGIVAGELVRLEWDALPWEGTAIVTAVPASGGLRFGDLVRGRAGPLTREWRRWLAVTGAVAGAGVVLLALLGASLNGALAPIVVAARRLGAGDSAALVPTTRRDELGQVAAVLNDLGVSLRAARAAWQREARLAAWREVAQGLAHEIKNPLMPIRGTLENLSRWRREEPQRFEEAFEARLGTVLEEVEHLTRLADEFSRFARLPEPAPGPVDLAGLAREVVGLQLGSTPEVTVVDRLEPMPPAHADAGLLRQVLTNLVKNAREALAGRGGTVEVAGGHGETGHWLEVSDDGPGAGPGALERLFRPGHTSRRERGGQGLGLWLCQRIVAEHGGTIEARPSPRGGLTVRLTLPDPEPAAGPAGG